jgi:hypothetical protein
MAKRQPLPHDSLPQQSPRGGDVGTTHINLAHPTPRGGDVGTTNINPSLRRAGHIARQRRRAPNTPGTGTSVVGGSRVEAVLLRCECCHLVGEVFNLLKKRGALSGWANGRECWLECDLGDAVAQRAAESRLLSGWLARMACMLSLRRFSIMFITSRSPMWVYFCRWRRDNHLTIFTPTFIDCTQMNFNLTITAVWVLLAMIVRDLFNILQSDSNIFNSTFTSDLAR